MRRFYISPEQIQQKQPRMTPQDEHHIRSVLRLKTGDTIVVFDGTGAQHEALIADMTHDHVQIRLIRPLSRDAESPLEITMAQGYLKDKKMDQLVRMLTELGVTQWMPFIAKRSVAVPDENRCHARLQRWQKISLEAVKQCRRSTPMTIISTTTFEAALAHSQPHDLKLLFWEGREGISLGELKRTLPLSPTSIFIMIGPEGGFDDREQQTAAAQDFHIVHMGPRILRAETAAVAACTMVQYVFGDMGEDICADFRMNAESRSDL